MYLREVKNFSVFFSYVKCLTVRRVLNFFQLYASFLMSRGMKRVVVWGQPYHVSIEPTTACNLACPECPSGLKEFTRPTGKLDLDNHAKWIQSLSKTVGYVTYYFQGEPFLHPQFLESIKTAKKYKMFTATSTNAHFIDKAKAKEIVASGLDQLIISVDGVSQSVYAQYRVHGDLAKVWEATRHLVEAKIEAKSSSPRLIFQCLAVKPNEHEIPLVFEKANELGVDEVRIKSAQLYDYAHGNPLMPENESYSRYKKQKSGTYVLKNPGGNHCWRMWSGSVITWNGSVVPCCFDKDAKHVLGSLKDDDFSTIWKSNTYKNFRKSVLSSRNTIDICKNCSEGSKVWL